MRILFYAHSSTLYGANRSLIDLILGLKTLDSKLDIYVIIPQKEPLGSELRKNSIKFKVIGHYSWFYNKDIGDNWKSKSKFYFKLWFLKNKSLKKIKNHRSLKNHLKFAKKINPDLIYVNSSLNPMGLIVSEVLSIKNIWHHRETVNEPLSGFYLENLDEFILQYKRTDLHLFPSRFLSKFYVDSFGNESNKIIFNGVIPDHQKPTRKFNPNKIRFGIVGRINKQKGQKEILNLFNNLDLLGNSFIELHLIGSGNHEFLDWYKNIKSTNIFHHELLDRYAIYDKFDFLISNASNEAFGRTIAEANYNGIPVIARNSGAFPELIINNVNGFLFDDFKELTNYIQILSHFNSNQYLEFSYLCYIHAKKHFDYIKVANKVLSEIKMLNNT